MGDIQKGIKSNHEETKKTKKEQNKPSCPSFLRGHFL